MDNRRKMIERRRLEEEKRRNRYKYDLPDRYESFAKKFAKSPKYKSSDDSYESDEKNSEFESSDEFSDYESPHKYSSDYSKLEKQMKDLQRKMKHLRN